MDANERAELFSDGLLTIHIYVYIDTKKGLSLGEMANNLSDVIFRLREKFAIDDTRIRLEKILNSYLENCNSPDILELLRHVKN